MKSSSRESGSKQDGKEAERGGGEGRWRENAAKCTGNGLFAADTPASQSHKLFLLEVPLSLSPQGLFRGSESARVWKFLEWHFRSYGAGGGVGS